MNYAEIRKVNVNEHIEQKNGLNYLSWAWAVDQLLQLDSTATWSYGEPVRFGETLMVFCTVKAFGKEMTAQLPVMDFRNKAIANPDAMSVNTAMQRCLAKAIALHGLGLYIYTGEDLPKEDAAEKFDVKPPKETIKPTAGALDGFSKEDLDILHELAEKVTTRVTNNEIKEGHLIYTSLDNDQRVALWDMLDSKVRTPLTKYNKELNHG
jgi:Protein of unknown function (DUF1071)